MIKKTKDRRSTNKINIMKISSGTLIGQVITVLTLPIISRIYGAEIIGIWTLINSISMVIVSFSDLGMSNSIMIEEEKYIESTYRVITSIVAIISIISSIVLSFYYTVFKQLHEMNSVFLFFLILFMFFITQQIQVCYTWLNRKGEYNVLMKNPLIKNGFYAFFAIILGLLGMKTYGYFIGYMAGLVITLFHMKRYLPKNFFTSKTTEYKEILKRNKRYVVYQMPTNIISSFKNQVPVLLVQGLWGTEILGYYSITVKLLQTPSSLLASSIGRIFFQITSEMKREGKEIGQYVYKYLTLGIKYAIIPMVFLIAFGDLAVTIFLGTSWKMAGDFVRILALQYYFMFLMYTLQGLHITLEKQNYAMISCVLQIVGYMLGALVGKYLFNNIYYGLAFMTIFFIIINIGFFSALFNVMKVSRRKYLLNVLISISVILILSFVVRFLFDSFGIMEFINGLLKIR